MSETYINIQEEDFDHNALLSWLQSNEQSYGALVTFTGVVRDSYSEDLKALFLEHYPSMTQKCLSNIIERARQRWDLGRVSVVHRVGRLENNDNIVFVGVISAHRVAAFEASQFIMDYLKKEAPFWKKEITKATSNSKEDEGCSEASNESEEVGVWVAQKETDLAAASQWEKPSESQK